MPYELWDYETGNCIGAYNDEDAALADVWDTVQRYGQSEALALVLLAHPADADAIRIAAAADLVALAQGRVRNSILKAPSPLSVGFNLIWHLQQVATQTR